jgi:hypothetical protein
MVDASGGSYRYEWFATLPITRTKAPARSHSRLAMSLSRLSLGDNRA